MVVLCPDIEGKGYLIFFFSVGGFPKRRGKRESTWGGGQG